MATKKKGNIFAELKKNPTIFVLLIAVVIIVVVMLANSGANASGSTGNNQGLPNGSGGGAGYFIIGDGEAATGGPWDSFFRNHPGAYHSKHHSTHGKSDHDHKKSKSHSKSHSHTKK